MVKKASLYVVSSHVSGLWFARVMRGSGVLHIRTKRNIPTLHL